MAYPFDGIEARNGRSVPSANRKSEALARKVGKPITAGSDAHTPTHIGEGYVEIPDGLETWQEVVEAVMAGKATAHSQSRHMKGTLKYGFKSIGEWMFRGFKKMRGRNRRIHILAIFRIRNVFNWKFGSHNPLF